MKPLKLLTFILALVLGANDLFAAPQIRYRITPIVDSAGNSITPTDMNRRGEVVGFFNPGNPRAFYWRNGSFIDITANWTPNDFGRQIGGCPNVCPHLQVALGHPSI